MSEAQYTLPWPPTVNHYRLPVRGRLITSKAGREYLQAALVAIKQQGGTKLGGRLAITIWLTVPDRRKRDVDNVLKPILDALTSGGAYEDDSQIDRLMVGRAGVGKPGLVHVTVQQIGEPVGARWALENVS